MMVGQGKGFKKTVGRGDWRAGSTKACAGFLGSLDQIAVFQPFHDSADRFDRFAGFLGNRAATGEDGRFRAGQPDFLHDADNHAKVAIRKILEGRRLVEDGAGAGDSRGVDGGHEKLQGRPISADERIP